MAGTERKIPWYSWIILAFHLVWNVGIILMTKGDVVNSTLRWVVTIVFLGFTAALGAYDFFIAKDSATRDDTPFDKWTISHTLAGVVFGVWYVPLLFVLITVLWWEAFEFSVTGFGEKEVILNRAVDMGVAIVGWLIVVVIAMLITGADFPWQTRFHPPEEFSQNSCHFVDRGLGAQPIRSTKKHEINTNHE